MATPTCADVEAEGELIDMIEDLSEGRVQFVFVKVKDPNSGLPKYVLIGWVCIVYLQFIPTRLIAIRSAEKESPRGPKAISQATSTRFLKSCTLVFCQLYPASFDNHY